MKKTAKVRNERKNKRRLLLLLIMAAVLFTLGALLITKNSKLESIKSEQVQLKEKVEQLSEKEIVIKKEIERLEDPNYVANLARRDYYLSKKEEYIFRIN